MNDLHVVYSKYCMVEKQPQLFSLETKKFSPLPEELLHFDNGTVLKNVNGEFVENPLTEEEKDAFSKDKDIKTALNQYIVSSCTGKTNYDAAWFACDFNPFMEAFTTFHFEV